MIVGQLFGVLLHSIDTPWHSIDKNIFYSTPTKILHITIFNKILFLSDLNYEDSRSLIINHIVIV